MAFNDRVVFNGQSVAVVVNGTVVGSDTSAGPTLLMSAVKTGTLSAQVTVDAETNTITLAARWQISQDEATWHNAVPSNNAANVVLATGTAGADAAVTKAVSAPSAVYGARFARVVIDVGVTNGTAVDSANVGYNYLLDALA